MAGYLPAWCIETEFFDVGPSPVPILCREWRILSFLAISLSLKIFRKLIHRKNVMF
jgi:hypothetical protein